MRDASQCKSLAAKSTSFLAGSLAVRVELGNRINDVTLCFARNLRINRQRQRFARGALRLRKIALLVAEIGKTFLLVESERIVDPRLNFAFVQMLTQRIAHWRADDVLVIDVMIR